MEGPNAIIQNIPKRKMIQNGIIGVTTDAIANKTIAIIKRKRMTFFSPMRCARHPPVYIPTVPIKVIRLIILPVKVKLNCILSWNKSDNKDTSTVWKAIQNLKANNKYTFFGNAE